MAYVFYWLILLNFYKNKKTGCIYVANYVVLNYK